MRKLDHTMLRLCWLQVFVVLVSAQTITPAAKLRQDVKFLSSVDNRLPVRKALLLRACPCGDTAFSMILDVKNHLPSTTYAALNTERTLFPVNGVDAPPTSSNPQENAKVAKTPLWKAHKAGILMR